MALSRASLCDSLVPKALRWDGMLLAQVPLALTLLLPLFAQAEPTARHHPVDIAPPAAMRIPAELPLENGRVVCATCHGTEGIEYQAPDRFDPKAPDFLRGGPYANLTRLCHRCHDEQPYQRPNVHALLDDTGATKKKQCEYCHTKAPDPEKARSREDVELRLPPEKLCLGCHLKTPHLNALEHSTKPDEKMRKRIEAAEKKHGVILPLDAEGRVTCVTCHSPHQKGVIDPERPAGRQVADRSLADGIGYDNDPWGEVYTRDKRARLDKLAQSGVRVPPLYYQRLTHEVLLRLPAKDGTLCSACHAFER